MEQRKKSAALAEIRGLYLPKYAVNAWEILDEGTKAIAAHRIKRVILSTYAGDVKTSVIKCAKCKQVKDRGDFHKSIKTKKGADSWCKSCRNEYQREWMAKKREERKNGKH